MTYRDRLERWRAEKRGGEEPTKPTKAPSDGFVGGPGARFQKRDAANAPGLLAGMEAAISFACEMRGDPEGNRAALIAEAAGLSVADQRDLLAHFRSEARIWAIVTGQSHRLAAAVEVSRAKEAITGLGCQEGWL